MFNLLRNMFIKQLKQRNISFSLQADHKVVLLGNITVILGDLSHCSDRQSALDAVDKLLETVLKCKKQYYSAQASDLYLLMVAPKNAHKSNDWLAIAAEIERDDRLARKHIWFSLHHDLESSFTDFIQTTFLATPGITEVEHGDALRLLNADIGLPQGWQEVLLNSDLIGTELVTQLMLLQGKQND